MSSRDLHKSLIGSGYKEVRPLPCKEFSRVTDSLIWGLMALEPGKKRIQDVVALPAELVPGSRASRKENGYYAIYVLDSR